jgi:flavin reductase (DIM6/NTAB) family NADH-FMN oxidoreductase RutF/rubredoxin
VNFKALYTINYGMYIVSAQKDGRFNGQVSNTVFQISSEPPTLAISVNKQNLSHEFIREGGYFVVSVLSKDAPLSLIGQFGFKSGREADKFAGINYSTGQSGVPYIQDYTLAYLEARVTKEVDVATHTIFIGEVVNAEVLQEGTPMTYAYYRLVKGGAVPKTAPTCIEVLQEGTKVVKAAQYRCTVCGYLYDPEKGDPDNGIGPGTPFEDLPDDWTCPVCGAAKDAFEKEN